MTRPSTKESREKPSIARDCWLFVLANGGWNRAKEVADELMLDDEQVTHCLNEQAKRGRMERRYVEDIVQGRNRIAEYRITKTCYIPVNTTLAMILKATEGVKNSQPQPVEQALQKELST